MEKDSAEFVQVHKIESNKVNYLRFLILAFFFFFF